MALFELADGRSSVLQVLIASAINYEAACCAKAALDRLCDRCRTFGDDLLSYDMAWVFSEKSLRDRNVTLVCPTDEGNLAALGRYPSTGRKGHHCHHDRVHHSGSLERCGNVLRVVPPKSSVNTQLDSPAMELSTHPTDER